MHLLVYYDHTLHSFPHYILLWPEDGPQWPKHVVNIINRIQDSCVLTYPTLSLISNLGSDIIIRSSASWDFTKPRFLICYRGFRINNGSHFQSSRPLNMRPKVWPSMLVTSNQSTLHNIPKERKSHLHVAEAWNKSIWASYFVLQLIKF